MRRVLASVALVAALGSVPQARAQTDAAHRLAGGCFALQAADSGRFAVRSGDGFAVTARAKKDAEPFRLQATDLGRYLLFGKERDFVAADATGTVVSAAQPGERADWRVEGRGMAFAVGLPAADRWLAVDSAGRLVLSATPAAFEFAPRDGCATYPESEVNVEGTPLRGQSPWDEVRGFIDPHLHWMAFEFLGGSAHCGRPWHRFGIAHALVDCPDHEPDGEAAALENALNGDPAGRHSTDGWPSFAGWPKYGSLTHEGSYFRWVERAWRAGLRLAVVLYVDNGVLCTAYPLKRNSCNEMDSVRLQAQRLREMIRYIDAQHGGPGKGWLQIVDDPFEAREVMNEGRLAVVQGIEVSRLFDCRELDGVPLCTEETIRSDLDSMYDLGIRQMEIVNKFDNALTGVAGDSGNTGLVVNNGNLLETGHFWRMTTCPQHPSHPDEHDKEQPTAPGEASGNEYWKAVFTNDALAGRTPVYPAPPHCNVRGLTELGRHLVDLMAAKGMIFDPDHMSVAARAQALTQLEAKGYSGVVSSHSWSTPLAYARILAMGGLVTPITKSVDSFVADWKELKAKASPEHLFGFGFGSDINGLHSQPGPTPGVRYPFRTFDGRALVHQVRTGEKTWDVKDGVDHYGLLPDWIEGLRVKAAERGDELMADMANGAEAYLQMWERAVGVDGDRCAPGSARVTEDGIAGVRLGTRPPALLRRAGQPEARDEDDLRFCVAGATERRVVASLSPRGRVRVVVSTAPGHRAGRITPGDPASTLAGYARQVAPGLFTRRTDGGGSFLFGVRRGRVRFVAATTARLAADPARLRRALRGALR